MKKFLTLIILLLLTMAKLAFAESKASPAFIEAHYISVAAASCLGIYLPDQSAEFNYLRSTGWHIRPQKSQAGKVEAHFSIAHTYYEDLGKHIYLVTFRGSASSKDWKINLKTGRVPYGGHTLAEMEAMANSPRPKNKDLERQQPAVHEGFNTYTNLVLKDSVLDPQGQLTGVFKKVQQEPNSYLCLTGHSLGGAVATLLGTRLLDLGMDPQRLKVITFGAPAVGNQAFVNAYADKLQLVRITNTADPVPGSLQTFFGGYKQFGHHYSYGLSPKVSSFQHDMAMYFDYSVGESFAAFDKEVLAGRLQDMPTHRQGKAPLVALWFMESPKLSKMTHVPDLKRFLSYEYRRMLPSYVLMDTKMSGEIYAQADIMAASREFGAEYVVIVGVDMEQPQREQYCYLRLDQAVFNKDGSLLRISSRARKVLPAIGNVQAAGEAFMANRKELKELLPFVVTERRTRLGL